jgi:hypothetical protein
MAVNPETLLYQRLRDNLPETCRITRIESRVGLGIPDCLVAIKNHGYAMLELKVVKRGRKVKLSPHQVSFHTIAGAMNLPCFILVQYHPPGAATLRGAQWLLYHARQVQDLLRDGVGLPPVESWPADQVLWHMVKNSLQGG